MLSTRSTSSFVEPWLHIAELRLAEHHFAVRMPFAERLRRPDQQLPPAAPTNATRSVPLTPRPASIVRVTASVIAVQAGRASAYRARPAGYSSTWRLVRWKSRTPRRRSSFAMVWLTLGGETCQQLGGAAEVQLLGQGEEGVELVAFQHGRRIRSFNVTYRS